MTDPIADMLTRVRNAVQAKHQKVDMPASRLKAEIARILKEEGYIAHYKTADEGGKELFDCLFEVRTQGRKSDFEHRAREPAGMPRLRFEDGNSEGARRSGHQHSDDVSRRHDGQAGSQEGFRRRTALQHLLRGAREMSRIGKKPIPVPDKVKIEIKADTVVVTGPKGTVSNPIPPGISSNRKDKEIVAVRQDDSGPQRAFHGLARALVANAVRGVTEGFTRELEIVGVGYRAEQRKNSVVFTLGFSHPIEYPIAAGISVTRRKADEAGRQRRGSAAGRTNRGEHPVVEETGSLQEQGYPLRRRASQEESRKGRR